MAVRTVESVSGKINKIGRDKKGYLSDKEIQLAVSDPMNNGIIIRSKVFQDLSPHDSAGEIRATDFIESGLAFNTVHELLDDSGNVVASIKGVGAKKDKAGKYILKSKDKATALPGYEVTANDGYNVGQEVWNATNGAGCQFKINVEGCHSVRGSVNGVEASYRVGNRVCVGSVASRKPGKGHK